MSSALAASRLVPPFARRLLVLPNARPPRVVAASSASSSSSRAGVVAMISASSSRATSADASPTETETRSGSCFCGAIVVALTGTPAAVSICHCVNCRKLSGAPFTAQALAKATAVEVRSARDAEMDQMVFSPGGDADAYLTAFSSSAAVDRYRCKECGSPVYASLAKGKMAAVPLSMLDGGGGGGGGGGGEAAAAAKSNAEPLRPTHHMYYADRIVDVPDDLPKYVKSAARDAKMWTGVEDDSR